MPVQKLRSLDEAREALWGEPGEPGHHRRIAWLWAFADRLYSRRFPPGVHLSWGYTPGDFKMDENSSLPPDPSMLASISDAHFANRFGVALILTSHLGALGQKATTLRGRLTLLL